MQENYHKILCKAALFQGVKKETLQYALENILIFECDKNQYIFDCKENSPALCIIMEGKASVYGISKSKPVILNSLTSGMIFGMASLFGDKCKSTSVKAKDKCVYAILKQEKVEKLLKLDYTFAKNYICILSDKIRFLNQKIAFFTSGNTEKKVMGYILSLPYDKETKSATLNTNMTKLANTLDIGRASLYRAFDSLEMGGFIEKNNNVIKFTSYEEFKKIYGELL